MNLLPSIIIIAYCLFTVPRSNTRLVWPKRTKVSEIVRAERRKTNAIVDYGQRALLHWSVLGGFFTELPDRVQQTLTVDRKTRYFLPVYTTYYFNQKDSLVTAAFYKWERIYYGGDSEWQQVCGEENKKLKQYMQLYNTLQERITAELGKPEIAEPTDGLDVPFDALFYQTIWKSPSMEAALVLTFSKIGKGRHDVVFQYIWK